MPDEEKPYINPNYVKEWENSRGVLARFDGYLNDLRKYGFTLITALFAISSFLLPYSVVVDETTGAVTLPNFPDNIKFVVLLINLLIIVAITVIDRTYTVFLKAAATRARVLERALNLELTEIITHRYRSAHSDGAVTLLYFFYIVMVLVLGGFVIGHDAILFFLLVVTGIVAILAILGIRNYIKVNYKYGPIDYTVDRLQCTQGDTIAITLTNLEKKDLIIEKGAIVYQIRTLAGKDIKTQKAENTIRLEGRDSYVWLWEKEDTSNVKAGIYEVWRPKATTKPQPFSDEKLKNVLNQQDLAELKKLYDNEKYVQLLRSGKEKNYEIILVPLTRNIRMYPKPSKPPQTDADKKLEMIKKLLK